MVKKKKGVQKKERNEKGCWIEFFEGWIELI